MNKVKEMILRPLLATAMIFTPVAATLPFIGCDNSGKEEQEAVTYTINAFGYNITVKDTIGDPDISDIVQKLQEAMNKVDAAATDPGDRAKFTTVLDRGLVIVVEGGADYSFAKPVNNHTMSFHVDYLLATDTDNIGFDIEDAIIYNPIYASVKSPNANALFWAAVERQKNYSRS